MIPLRDQELLRGRFKADLPNRVRLDYFTQKPSPIFIPGRQECQFCREVQTVVEELAHLSERISLTVHDIDAEPGVAKSFGIDKVPAVIIRGQTNRPLRFFGLPTGSIFLPFVESIIEASTGSVELRPETVRHLRKLKTDLGLQVIVSTGCQFSPVLVRTATKLGLQSNRVKVEIVEALEYPQLIQRANVRVTPTTIFDDKLAVPGAMEESTLMQILLTFVEGRPMAGNLNTGQATRLPELQQDQQQGRQQPPEVRSSGGLILPR